MDQQKESFIRNVSLLSRMIKEIETNSVPIVLEKYAVLFCDIEKKALNHRCNCKDKDVVNVQVCSNCDGFCD